MKLVIAEKNSVARAIADVLGAKSKGEGYYEGGGYVVSWCVGHLLGLAEPQAYDERYARWRYNDLPILPKNWKYTPIKSSAKQLKTLLYLIKRDDVTEIINACDAGREGELIFRLVISHGRPRCKKPVWRLWVSSMEERAIADGFAGLRPAADYEPLYHAAVCRARADWLVGMNYSRLFSVLYSAQLRVGRVQTPTLAMIVEREERIRTFVPEIFYVVELSGAGFIAESKRFADKPAAVDVRDKCQGKTAVISSAKKQQKITAAPKLYDLTTLQREANRLFGYTAEQTLAAAQALYESKAITYPRTDSRYLTQDMAAGLMSLANLAAGLLPFLPPINDLNPKAVINNTKVTDHHAIIPTPTAPKLNISSLEVRQRHVFWLVCTRFVSAMSEGHVFDETAVVVLCEGEQFSAKGKVIINNGWKTYEQALVNSLGQKAKKEPEPLPDVIQGQQFTAKTGLREGATTPPKHYTEDTLLSAMENAGNKDMPQEMERRGIGTPATRANIIETLVNSGFVRREKKQLRPTDQGINLIAVVPDSVKSPMLTADWEHSLKSIERGELTGGEFMAAICAYISDTVAAFGPADVSAEGKARFAGQQKFRKRKKR